MYFSYDPNGEGLVMHDSEEKARLTAEGGLVAERNAACVEGEWDDEAEMICWGKVFEKAAACISRIDEEDLCDFILKKV